MNALIFIIGLVIGLFAGFVFCSLLSSASNVDRCRECIEDRIKYEQKTEKETDKNEK